MKQVYPNARVIWNDFDDYNQRLDNIPKTNELLEKIKEITQNIPKHQRLKPTEKEEILNLIKQEKGFVDYITLSSNLLFSAKYITDFQSLTKETFYNNLKLSPYNAEGYLQGVERVQMDYKDLFDLYKNTQRVVFVIDPPYLSTDCTTYQKMQYWKLGDYLDILKTP